MSTVVECLDHFINLYYQKARYAQSETDYINKGDNYLCTFYARSCSVNVHHHIFYINYALKRHDYAQYNDFIYNKK